MRKGGSDENEVVSGTTPGSRKLPGGDHCCSQDTMATMLLGLLALALVAPSGAAFCGAVPRSASHRSTTMPRMSVDLEGEAAVPPPALDMLSLIHI